MKCDGAEVETEVWTEDSHAKYKCFKFVLKYSPWVNVVNVG